MAKNFPMVTGRLVELICAFTLPVLRLHCSSSMVITVSGCPSVATVMPWHPSLASDGSAMIHLWSGESFGKNSIWKLACSCEEYWKQKKNEDVLVIFVREGEEMTLYAEKFLRCWSFRCQVPKPASYGVICIGNYFNISRQPIFQTFESMIFLMKFHLEKLTKRD